MVLLGGASDHREELGFGTVILAVSQEVGPALKLPAKLPELALQALTTVFKLFKLDLVSVVGLAAEILDVLALLAQFHNALGEGVIEGGRGDVLHVARDLASVVSGSAGVVEVSLRAASGPSGGELSVAVAAVDESREKEGVLALFEGVVASPDLLVETALDPFPQFDGEETLMLPDDETAAVSDLSDIEGVLEDLLDAGVAEGRSAHGLSREGDVGLGAVALLVDMARGCADAAQFKVGLVDETHDGYFGLVDLDVTSVLGVEVIAEAGASAVEALLLPPDRCCAHTLSDLLALHLSERNHHFEYKASHWSAGVEGFR